MVGPGASAPAYDQAIANVRSRISQAEATAAAHAAAQRPDEEREVRLTLLLIYEELDALIADRARLSGEMMIHHELTG